MPQMRVMVCDSEGYGHGLSIIGQGFLTIEGPVNGFKCVLCNLPIVHPNYCSDIK